jgi:hypothetical protein
VEGDGTTPLLEALVSGLPLLRRGMSAIVITPSTEPGWVRPLATLRPRGIGCQVVWLDPAVYARHAAELDGRAADPAVGEELAALEQAARNTRHQVAEFDLRTHAVPPGVPLGEALVG